MYLYVLILLKFMVLKFLLFLPVRLFNVFEKIPAFKLNIRVDFYYSHLTTS